MAIFLKPEQERFIQSQIDAGQFSNPEQVIDTAFRLLEPHSAEYIQWVRKVWAKVTIAKDEVARSEVLDGETVVNDILERFRQARATKSDRNINTARFLTRRGEAQRVTELSNCSAGKTL